MSKTVKPQVKNVKVKQFYFIDPVSNVVMKSSIKLN